MYIFLGIALELASIIGSSVIAFNAILDGALEIPKNGYKIDKGTLEEITKKNRKKQKRSKFQKTLDWISLFIPGINLISASVGYFKYKNSIMNDPQIKEVIVPMTEEEKMGYSKIKSKLDKIEFITSISENQENKSFVNLYNKKDNDEEYDLLALFDTPSSIHYEELEPLNYTLEEVKKLNEVTNYSYRIGKIEGKYVAIIGILNQNTLTNRLKFMSENYEFIHTFDKITDEEAKSATFTVYPIFLSTRTKENLDKVIEEIKTSRGIYEKDQHLTNEFNYDTLIDNNDTKIEEQGPVLKKSLK